MGDKAVPKWIVGSLRTLLSTEHSRGSVGLPAIVVEGTITVAVV